MKVKRKSESHFKDFFQLEREKKIRKLFDL